MIKQIDFETAHRLMGENKNFILLDVREEEEFITGHAYDAVLLPVDAITEETASETVPDKTTTLFIYCRSGRRSKMAAEKFELYGYSDIYDLGGLIGWPYGLEV